MKPTELCQRIEECALNAWPALQQTLYDGWVLRFANGFTKRANSVNAVYPGVLELNGKITSCERAYRNRGLRPIFRLTSFSAPPRLDDMLAERGYEYLDPTDVLALGMEERKPSSAGTRVTDVDLDTWMAAFCQISGCDPNAEGTHRRMLEGSVGKRFLALRYQQEQPVCCGLGILEDSFLGIFDIATAAAQRRQGHATQLITAMLDWASERGAKISYLQVMKSNASARQLYDKLGFSWLYDYWYRRGR